MKVKVRIPQPRWDAVAHIYRTVYVDMFEVIDEDGAVRYVAA